MEEIKSTEKVVEVMNRHSGTVGYTFPDTGFTRVFNRGEVRKVPLDELQKLAWVDGGDYILKNYLMIKDKDALSYLDMEVEPEYNYDEPIIRKLLLEGSVEQLEDTLNYAPEGVIELIKTVAVAIQLPDTRKRELISKRTGFSIDSAILINKELADDAGVATAEKKERKAAPMTVSDGTPARKAAPYTIKKD